MEQIPVLRDLVVLVAIAIPAVLLAHRLKIPTLVGDGADKIFAGLTSVREVLGAAAVW